MDSGILFLLFVAAVAVWLIHSWFRPYAKCWKCRGNPKNFSKSGRSWNIRCLVCKSTGKRRRLGALLLGRGFGEL